jgi:hypothetical protein
MNTNIPEEVTALIFRIKVDGVRMRSHYVYKQVINNVVTKIHRWRGDTSQSVPT